MSITPESYVRHRDRMIQESVFEDLVNALIALRWIPGTTTREVYPIDSSNRAIVTTAESETLGMVREHPVTLTDYFAESGDQSATVGEGRGEEGPRLKLNTMAVDDGVAGEPVPIELGSTLAEISYRFTFAFWAESVGVAQAMLNDLRDRYRGVVVAPAYVELFDYVTDPDARIATLDVETFVYTRDPEDDQAGLEGVMFYAQLTLLDTVD